MMLDVLGLNSDSAVWRRLLLDVSLFSLKILRGVGTLFHSAQTSLPSTGENQSEMETNGEESRAKRKGRDRRSEQGKRQYHFS